MDARSNPIEPANAAVIGRSRTRPYRQKIRTLSHVNLDAANGAVLRDLSEFGIALQTVSPLTLDQQVRLHFDLPAPRVRIEAAGRIAWTDPWGQAGVQFVDLPERSRRSLKEWIFFQILSNAYLFSPTESITVEGNRADGATELLFSASPRPAIRLETPATPLATAVPVAQRVRLHWCPIPVTLRALAKTLDGLILVCAVLLFAVMSMVMTDVLPTWLITIPLAIIVAGIFGAIYWFLFVFWFSSTPGEHLARMASLGSGGTYSEEEDQARFR
jgi:PilZ domain